MVNKIFAETEEKMKKALEVFRTELAGVRTGKANAALLDTIRVVAYGSTVPLRQVASVGVPDARMIVIQPWDRSTIQEIEKAILKSDLGLVPSNDGTVIRLAVPPLSEERRGDLVKVVKRLSEEAKIAVRNLRRDANEHIKGLSKDGAVSKDEEMKAHERMQQLTDRYTELVEEVLSKKEKEIREV
jgi:ribosome recycling factor